MQLIADSMLNQDVDDGPMRRLGGVTGHQESNGSSAVGHRSQQKDKQQLEDEEQRDIENFQDSPRQNDRLDNDDTQR